MNTTGKEIEKAMVNLTAYDPSVTALLKESA
jgi:hypothetical protein